MKTKRKNAKKGLHKGKKIEAKKPLFMGLEHGSLTGNTSGGQQYLTMNLNTTAISSVPPVK
jgi:hypothetical protein